MATLRVLSSVMFVMFCLTEIVTGWQYLTTRRVTSNSNGPTDILDVVSRDIDFKYTDNNARLTAIKDKKFRSCFIADYDPYWSLFDEDKEIIVTSRNYRFEDVQALERKAGQIIAHMCKHYKQFWLNENDEPSRVSGSGAATPSDKSDILELPPKEPQSPHLVILNPDTKGDEPKYDGGHNGAPPMMPGQNPNQSILGSLLVAPPSNNGAPPLIGQQEQQVSSSSDLQGGPPPLSEWRLDHPVNSNGPALVVQSSNTNVDAPPPLSVWRQSHRIVGVPPQPPASFRDNSNDMEAPPPLSVWQAQHERPSSDLFAPPLASGPNIDSGSMQAPPPIQSHD